jgi:hypothetical protein
VVEISVAGLGSLTNPVEEVGRATPSGAGESRRSA